MEEIWKPIPGAPRYQASSEGRIKGPRRILKPQNHPLGYRIVSVEFDGRFTSKTVHSLVALAFLGPRPAGKEVAHWDGDKTNNGPFNLRYCTHAENMADNKRNGVWCGHRPSKATITEGWSVPTRKGKLTPEQRTEIITRIFDGASQGDLGREFGVSQSTISRLWKRTVVR